MQWIWLALALVSLALTAEGSPIFGPQAFVREAGAPQDVTIAFGRQLVASDYRLVVINGAADASHRVSSAWVWLNGSTVLQPSDFNQGVGEITRPVTLRAENTLTVRLAGSPGGVLTISIAAALGPNGGDLVTPGGARLSLPPGALAREIPIDLTDQTLASLGASLPPGYAFLGAVSINLGDAQLAKEAALEIPVDNPPVGQAIVARVLRFEATNLLTLVDTATLVGSGFLRTNSPPFPGVRTSGDYIFMAMPMDLGIVGTYVTSSTSAPIEGALVSVLLTSPGIQATSVDIDQALASLSAFVGQSDATGFAAVPGVIPFSDVAAVAFSPSQGDLAQAGTVQFSVGGIVTNGLLGNGIRNLTVDQLVDTSTLPCGPPPPCPCQLLTVDPHAMGEPPPLLFLTGDSQDIRTVFCGQRNVTASTDLAALARGLLTTGASVHITCYSSANPNIASITPALICTGPPPVVVTAQTPGDTDILIETTIYRFYKICTPRGDLFPIQPCPAFGAVHPVRVSPTLAVDVNGSGSGFVDPNPSGTVCGVGCSAYPLGTTVQLTARPGPNSTFTGWSGDCSGTSPITTVTMTGDKTCTAEFDIGGEVLAPSASSHYEFLIYTVPANVNGATVTATATWASDWYPPPPPQHTTSFPNLVEVPYLGEFGCDFISRNHPQNNFVEFEMDTTNPNAVRVGSINVGPGKRVAIAGSDCSFGDNVTFHYLLKWIVKLH